MIHVNSGRPDFAAVWRLRNKAYAFESSQTAASVKIIVRTAIAKSWKG